jgi:hypothetical protein
MKRTMTFEIPDGPNCAGKYEEQFCRFLDMGACHLYQKWLDEVLINNNLYTWCKCSECLAAEGDESSEADSNS